MELWRVCSMRFLASIILLTISFTACNLSTNPDDQELGDPFSEDGLVPPDPDADGTGAFGISPIADRFEYPIKPGAGAKIVGEYNKNTTQEGDWFYRNGFGSYCANCGGFRGFHPGEDWNLECAIDKDSSCDLGQPVYAVANGTVIKAWDVGSGLKYGVVIKHLLPSNENLTTYILPSTKFPSGVGPEFRSVYSGYLHMKDIYVKDGQEVNIGDLIGRIGNVNGPHLHFEMRYTTVVRFPDYKSSPQALTDRGMLTPSKFIEAHKYKECDGVNIQSCNACGVQTRTCDYGKWSPWTQCSASVCTGPSVSVNPLVGKRGQTFLAPGSGFSANQKVAPWIQRPDGSLYAFPHYSVDGNGNYKLSINTSINAQIGPHVHWSVDLATGRPSNRFVFNIEDATGTSTSGPLIAISPGSGPKGTKFVVKGSGFAASAYLVINTKRPDGSVFYGWPRADSTGNLVSYDLQTTASTQSGQFDIYIYDETSAKQSNHVLVQVLP